MTDTPERPELDELNERLRLFANAWLSAAAAKTGPAISHWSDKVDEHRRAIRELFASSLGEPVSQEAQLAEMEARKDAAYLERNQVVAALAKVVLLNGGKAGIQRTAIEGWSDDWHGCVYIDTPWGQASWHYHDSQSSLFASLPAYRGEWDGHTTEEKYARLASPSGSPASSPEAPIAAIRKAMLLLEAKLGDTDVTHHVDEYEEPLVAAFQVLLAASRSAFSGIPRTENEPGEGVVRCAKCARWHSGVNNADVKTNLCEDCASVISSASPLSEDDMSWIRNTLDEMGEDDPSMGSQWDAKSTARLLRIFARLSASAPSPEDKGSADTPDICRDCDGSGEGAVSEITCSRCDGSGAEPSERKEADR